ncbi:beta-1,4-galactosyltransferase 1-like isoform X2 [Tachysurus fulvidraco]|uniref:beta-1,4-galactosyltransferase 1-like isoform X2 n=1 Tax=Tachysurus fulvidraco TaxID=1234273 RepID=UPI000F4ED0E0|nr:beta-1,4-galactosyltransferase 1-like isoform X2 [Tachysurus fulvidraco]
MRDPNVNFNFLQKTCTLIVLLCCLHIFVTVVYYVRSLDFRQSFVQNQQQMSQIHGKLEEHTTGTEELKSSSTLTYKKSNVTETQLEKCPDPSPLLVGPLRVEFNVPVNLDEVRNVNSVLQEGGRFRPKDCIALQKVAIIIPFRNRDEHLKYWLHYLHPILQRQQLDYGVYIINQDGEETFNRAKLLNVGYAEALKEYDYDCFIFSDVDLIPMDDRNTYKCFSQPRHLSVSMDKFGFRLSSKGMVISRPSGVIGKCRMVRHSRDKQNNPNPLRFDRISHTRETMNSDGINSLSYKVVKVEKDKLYTKITVDVGKP